MLADVPSRVVHKPGRFAVLLNARAKAWTGDLHEAISRWVPSRDLFLTDDFRQAEKTVDRILASGEYDVVFTGGGDGTIMYLVSAIEERIREGMIDRSDAPPVGVLRMGTGNALATYLGCRSVVEDLRALSGGSPIVIYDIAMIDTDEHLVPFAGFGWDALILNDYDSFKNSVRETAFEQYATGLGGYAAAIMSRSIPNALKSRRLQARVTNMGEHAARITQDGEIIDEYGPDEQLFEGEVRVLSGSTIPYWGFEIRMFPNCTRLPGHFSLRCYHGTIPSVLTHLRGFWKGYFPDDEIDNFLVQSARVEILNGAMPYHMAGDPAGYERVVDWAITEHPARLAVPLR